MKKCILSTMMSLLCALFIVSCGGSKESAKDSNAYRNVLPGSAYVIAKVDLGNLLAKSDVLDNTIVKAAFDKAVNNAPENIKSLLKNIYKNPKKSGVDVDAPVYAAIVGLEPAELLLTMAMDDVKVFEKMLSTLSEGQFQYTTGNGMKHIDINDSNVAVAYDSEKIIFVYSYNADVTKYTTLQPDKMAEGSKVFAPVFSDDDDVELAVNIEPLLMKMLQEGELDSNLKPFVAMTKDIGLYASLNFETGFANLEANVNLPAEYSVLVDNIFKTPSHRHLDYIPANSFAVMNYNLDMNQLFPILESAGLLKMLANEGISEEIAKGVLEAVSGDYTAALWTEGEELQYMAAIDCSDRSVFDMIASYVIYEFDATMVDTDVYALNLNREEYYNYYTYEYDYVTEGYDYYLMYKDGAIMIMPENLYSEITSYGEFSPLPRSAVNNRLFASMSNDIVVAAAPLCSYVSEMISNDRDYDEYGYGPSDDELALLEALKMVENMTVDFRIYKLDAKLNVVNKSINSLKYIVDSAISLGMRYN